MEYQIGALAYFPRKRSLEVSKLKQMMLFENKSGCGEKRLALAMPLSPGSKSSNVYRSRVPKEPLEVRVFEFVLVTAGTNRVCDMLID